MIKARLFGNKATGGQVEVLVERVLNDHEVLAHVRASKSPKAGSALILEGGWNVEVIGRQGDLFLLRFLAECGVLEILSNRAPSSASYITHTPDGMDETRYQTVYAQHAGAVAAPTAGLHFDEATLATLASKGANSICDLVCRRWHLSAGSELARFPSIRCIPSCIPCRKKRWRK